MTFAGKIAYLVLFPGAVSLLLAGAVARWSLGAFPAAARIPAAAGRPGLVSAWRESASGTGAGAGDRGALAWFSPPAALFALSWVACIVTGFLGGDLVLVYFLVLLALFAREAAGLAAVDGPPGAGGIIRHLPAVWCAAALGTALAVVVLRTGEVELSKVIGWQVLNGPVLAYTGDGALAVAGGALGCAGALAAAMGMMRLRPFWPDEPAGESGKGTSDTGGIPGAIDGAAGLAALVVAPVLVTALYFAGGAGTWYGLLLWVLKVIGVLALAGLVDAVSARYAPAWMKSSAPVAGCAFSLAGLVLVWIGVSL